MVLSLQVLTRSKGGSLGSKMEVEEEGGEVAATCISVHSLAGAACGDMADEKHRIKEQKYVIGVSVLPPFHFRMTAGLRKVRNCW